MYLLDNEDVLFFFYWQYKAKFILIQKPIGLRLAKSLDPI